jgi:hypothetical protein
MIPVSQSTLQAMYKDDYDDITYKYFFDKRPLEPREPDALARVEVTVIDDSRTRSPSRSKSRKHFEIRSTPSKCMTVMDDDDDDEDEVTILNGEVTYGHDRKTCDFCFPDHDQTFLVKSLKDWSDIDERFKSGVRSYGSVVSLNTIAQQIDLAQALRVQEYSFLASLWAKDAVSVSSSMPKSQPRWIPGQVAVHTLQAF